MLTHEEWVNAGRYESWFGARPPASPARDTKRRKWPEESAIAPFGIRSLFFHRMRSMGSARRAKARSPGLAFGEGQLLVRLALFDP
jgi:hypothetical protein